MLQLAAIRRKLNRHGGQDGTFLGTVRDRRASAFGLLLALAIHRNVQLGHFSHVARYGIRASAQFHQHRTCHVFVLLRDHLLVVDVAV